VGWRGFWFVRAVRWVLLGLGGVGFDWGGFGFLVGGGSGVGIEGVGCCGAGVGVYVWVWGVQGFPLGFC